jgi:hypothetical protein
MDALKILERFAVDLTWRASQGETHDLHGYALAAVTAFRLNRPEELEKIRSAFNDRRPLDF